MKKGAKAKAPVGSKRGRRATKPVSDDEEPSEEVKQAFCWCAVIGCIHVADGDVGYRKHQ